MVLIILSQLKLLLLCSATRQHRKLSSDDGHLQQMSSFWSPHSGAGTLGRQSHLELVEDLIEPETLHWVSDLNDFVEPHCGQL